MAQEQEQTQPKVQPIDTKFKFVATSAEHGKTYTEADAVVFLAHDKSLLHALDAYLEESVRLRATPEQLGAIQRLIVRVTKWQLSHPNEMKVADVLPGKGV